MSDGDRAAIGAENGHMARRILDILWLFSADSLVIFCRFFGYFVAQRAVLLPQPPHTGDHRGPRQEIGIFLPAFFSQTRN